MPSAMCIYYVQYRTVSTYTYCSIVQLREKRDLERKCRENIDIWVKVVRWVHCRPASTEDSVLGSDAVQNLLCWLACYVLSGPPSPKFQITPSQLRQRADRAAGLSIKGLWSSLYGIPLSTGRWDWPPMFMFNQCGPASIFVYVPFFQPLVGGGGGGGKATKVYVASTLCVVCGLLGHKGQTFCRPACRAMSRLL